jgi:archaellum component FlaF (FlaF/FlaG flagellin family)
MKVKGVSPVVAEVLLMGIAISAAISAGVVLQDTFGGVQENVEDWISQDDREQQSSIGVDYGYNSTDGFLMVDVRNTGANTLTVEEQGEKVWNMYLDGRPETWSYVTGSPYSSSSNVGLDPSSTITLNTTREFPSPGNSVEVEVTGAFNTRSTYVCFSENGGCES